MSDSKHPFCFGPEDVVAEPFPSVLKDGFLEPDLYARLKAEFPPAELMDQGVNARAGRDLYRGDAYFEEFIAGSAAWREFYQYANSPAFISFVLDLFGTSMAESGCELDPQRCRFTDYVEPREGLRRPAGIRRPFDRFLHRMLPDVDPNELFVRFDLAKGGAGYHKKVHTDLPNRLITMLIFFCDADEIGLEGGELRIHEPRRKRAPEDYPRHPNEEDTRITARILPRDNLGLTFLCCNYSYHSVTAVTAHQAYRDFIYMSVASRAPYIWKQRLLAR